jgi:hypothetical protein
MADEPSRGRMAEDGPLGDPGRVEGRAGGIELGLQVCRDDSTGRCMAPDERRLGRHELFDESMKLRRVLRVELSPKSDLRIASAQ